MEVKFCEECTDDKKVTIAVCGRIDSGNAEAFEKALMDLYEQNKRAEVKLNFKDVEYISSAGLRVILKLKKACGNLSILDVSSEVYDIFDVTGFSEILEIHKALREITVDESQIIARGGQGVIYKLGEDEIVKVFSERTPYNVIEDEAKFAKSAFVSGVPTAIPFDIVKCKGNYGLVFEMVKADVIAKKFQGDASDFDTYSIKYAELFSSLKNIQLDKNVFENVKTVYEGYIDRLGEWYTEEELKKLRKFLSDIPEGDTMIHGDFHTNNVMIQDGELLIIDMAEISYGHPIFDLASSYFVHVVNAKNSPETVPTYLGITADVAQKLWSIIMRVYFKTEDPEALEKYDRAIEGACMFKTAILPAIYVNAGNATKQRLAGIAKQYFFPRMDEILEGIQSLPIYKD